MTEKTGIIEIYTEYTPNPDSLKFVTNRMLLPGKSVDFRNAESVRNAPLAAKLFELSFVEGVFITNNFVTITKKNSELWEEIVPAIKDFLKNYITEGKEIVKAVDIPDQPLTNNGNGAGLESRIVELLDAYVKPAVEMDGGAIQFKSFNDGVVTLLLQGSCSGCPSATLTLKSGIEGLLKKMIPEVKEVVAEEI